MEASASGIVRSRLIGLSIILVIGFLLLVSLVISTALAALSDYFDWILPGLATILHVVHLALSFGFTTALFAMIFKILPDKAVRWEEVWLGAAIASLLFTIGKHLISLYIGSSNIDLWRSGCVHYNFGLGILLGTDPAARRGVRQSLY
ncbi:MAG: YihY/virulence factor BrkB family protein [Alphaproteobacteria bacterium]|nr:YihY/virulence factor BrkB family protein [Alphaproteobacteria bacterium]